MSDTKRRVVESMDSREDDLRHSFDRFGDDLSQLLLSFLPLEERFRFECLSKQSKRLIFTSLTRLEMKETISGETFEAILKKCQNIASIEVSNNNHMINEMFESIVKHCNHLNAICIDCGISGVKPNDPLMDQFFAKFGKQLKSMSFKMSANCLDKNVKNLTNLTQIQFKDKMLETIESHLLAENETTISLPKLKSIKFIMHSNECDNCLTIFANNYRNHMKSVDVSIGLQCGKKSIANLMSGLSRMHRLVDLKLMICMFRGGEMATTLKANQLKQIGIKCPKLKSLTLLAYIEKDVNCDQLMQTINQNFKHLRRLEVRGTGYLKALLASDSLPRLTHLSLFCFNKMQTLTKKFADNIHIKFPRLQFIHLFKLDVTDVVLNGLSKCPKLQTIKLEGNLKYTPLAVNTITEKCPKIVTISIEKSSK